MNLEEIINKKNNPGQNTDGRTDDAEENRAGEESEGGEAHEGNIIQLVSFLLADVEYGINILSVHEILRIVDITDLPNTPDFIEGVINLRGNVVPVVNVRKRFGFPTVKHTDLSRIIVIETMEKQVGLLVDNVYQVVRISDNNVDKPDDLLEGVSKVFIEGIGRLKDRLIIILNLDNILFL